jgi:hypothetical protein
MLENIKKNIISHLVGLIFIFGGWYVSILNVGLARFQENVLFTKTTLIGLLMIIIGAYIPNIWNKIRGN